jgi:hypothetical protein
MEISFHGGEDRLMLCHSEPVSNFEMNGRVPIYPLLMGNLKEATHQSARQKVS